VCLGDVSGKGLPASLLMANTQATLRGQTLLANSAKECIQRSNTLLFRSTSDEKFVTLFYGILDFARNELRFCNAGHDNPYLLSEGKEPRRLKTGGIVLSVMEEFPYDEEVVGIEPGEMLVIYSDGIPEAMNMHQELFSDLKLGALLKDCPSLSAMEVIDKVVAAAKAHAGNWPQSDDMTMLVVKRLKG
jgi:sigma-B regulation protein RsbU (phosphoserine phosphatase)